MRCPFTIESEELLAKCRIPNRVVQNGFLGPANFAMIACGAACEMACAASPVAIFTGSA